MQKFIRVSADNTNEVNQLLEIGWVVKEFQSLSSRIEGGFHNPRTYAYVLLER